MKRKLKFNTKATNRLYPFTKTNLPRQPTGSLLLSQISHSKLTCRAAGDLLSDKCTFFLKACTPSYTALLKKWPATVSFPNFSVAKRDHGHRPLTTEGEKSLQSKYTAFLLLATDFAHGRGTDTFPCSVEHPGVGSPPAQRVPMQWMRR